MAEQTTFEIINQTEDEQTVKLDATYSGDYLTEILATFKPDTATIHMLVSGGKSKKFRLSSETADAFAQAWTEYRLEQQRQHEKKLAEYTLRVAAITARVEKLGGTLTPHRDYEEMPYWFQLNFDAHMQWHGEGSYDISLSSIEERVARIKQRIADGSYITA